jgi:hypothetical protein
MSTDSAIALVTLANARAMIGKVTTEGAEMAPALETAGWTCADGWSAGSGVLAKAAGTGTGTATPSGTFSVVAGTTYKVTITCLAVSGSLAYTLGGVMGAPLAVGTITEYITALTTGKIIFSGGAAVTASIIALSVKAISGEIEDDALIEMIIDGVSADFNSYVGRRILEQTETTAYLDGSGREILLLPRRPVTSIASVTENDALLVEGEEQDYRLYTDEGMLIRLSGKWAKGRKNIVLGSYKSGYAIANLPKDLKLAALKQVAFEYQEQRTKSWGEVSRSMSDGSVSKREVTKFLPDVKETLDRYLY